MKSTKTLNSVLLLAITAALASGAFAQEKDDTDSESGKKSSSKTLEQITVTGSRIEGAAAASPVVSIGREEIDARGLSSIQDVMRYIPQNFSSTNSGGGVDGRSPRFDGGAVTVNLRGLGEGSTLVLVNGKRIASSPAESGTFTDVSTIPFGAIERVEVLTDGASAIYGSDAVGGVINFILRKDYRGLQSRVRFENSSNGGDAMTLEQTGGFSWDSGNLTGSLSYETQDPANRLKAGVPTDSDFSAQGGRIVTPLTSQVGSSPTRMDRGPFDLTPDSDQISAYLDFRQEITSNIDLSLSGLYSDRESTTRDAYTGLRITVPDTNYYSMTAVPPLATGRASYAFFNETDSGALARPISTSISTRYNITASLDWALPFRDWELNGTFGFGESEFDGNQLRLAENSAPVLAAAASSDPNTAINFWGDGSSQHPDLNSLRVPRDLGSRVTDQEYFTLGWRGTMLALPAGDVKFNVGAEFRDDSTDFRSFGLNPIAFADPSLANFVPKVENQAFLAEVNVPLLSNKSLAHDLSLSIAARYDEYNLSGPFEGPLEPFSTRTIDDVVPKVGLAWYPTEALKIRATWGEAFQAPTLVELFRPQGLTTWFFPVFDPFDPVDPTAPRIVGTIFGGNSSLKAQTSETTTIGFDYQSNSIEGLSISMTWNETEFVSLIGTLADVYGFDSATPLLIGHLFPDAIVRNPDGSLREFNPFLPINLGGRTSKSIDFSTRYAFETSQGDFEVGLQGVRQLGMDLVAAPGVDPIETKSSESAPADWNLNAYLDWHKGDWSASFNVNHESGYTIIFDAGAVRPDVSGYTTFDSRVGYQTDSGWRFALGVNNLFDEDFPFADNGFGVDSSRVDFRGRVIHIDLTKEFSF